MFFECTFITFSNFKIVSEAIEVTLDDQGESWDTKKYAKTQVDVMLKFLDANKKISLRS